MTKKHDVITETQNLMNELIKAHDDELTTCQKNVDDAKAQIETASKTMADAAANTDLDKYADAKADKARAETALEMYNIKLKKAQAAGYADDDLNNTTIQKLFKHRDELDDAYFNEAKPHILALMGLSARYDGNMDELRVVFNEWTTKVHKFDKPGYSNPFQSAQMFDGKMGIELNHALDGYRNNRLIMNKLHTYAEDE